MDEKIELNGIRVLVTGATSGLGAAMARALAAAGARVMVTGRDRERAAAAARALGSTVISSPLDVRNERSVAVCVARANDAWGGIDMLVNNAGIGMRTVNPRFLSAPQPFWEVTPAGFRDVMETKVVGCFLMAREVVTVNTLLPGGRGTRTGMIPDDVPADVSARLLDPEVMGPPIVWLASDRAAGVHNRRIVAHQFDPTSVVL